MFDNPNTADQEGKAIDPNLELPGDPVLRQELKDGIKELVGSMIRVQGEKDFQSKALKEIAKKVGMKPAKIRKFAKWKFKGSQAAQKEASDVTAAEAAFDILYNGQD